MSLSIEVTQILLDLLINANRVFEIDDLWTNTLGGYLAWRAFQLGQKIWKNRQDDAFKRDQPAKGSDLGEKNKFFLDKKKGKAYNKINHQKSNNFSTFRESVVGGNRQWKIMKWADAKNEFEAIKIR